MLVLQLASLLFCLAVWGIHLAIPDANPLVHVGLALVCLTLQIAYTCLASKPRPLLLFCGLYFSLFFFIPGLYHIQLGIFPFFSATYPVEQISKGAAVAAVFCCASLSAYLAIDRRATIHTETYGAPPTVVWSRVYSAWLILMCGAFLALGLVGSEKFSLVRGDVTAEDASSPLELVGLALGRVFSMLAVLLSILLLRWHKKSIAVPLLICSLFLLGMVSNPLTIPRYVLASYIITIILVVTPLTMNIRLLIVTGMVASQFTIFPWLSAVSRSEHGVLIDFSPLEYISTHGDFDGLQSTINIAMMTDFEGLRLGRQLLSAALFFVPRSIWPNKSIGTGGEAGDFMGYAFNNLSAPLPAELYSDFGLIGTIVGAIVFGATIQRMDQNFSIKQSPSHQVHRLVTALLTSYIFIILRGSLVGVLGPAVLSIFIALLIRRLITSNST